AWPALEYACDVAVQDERVVAFVVTRSTAPNESEVLNLAVHPSYRRRGIAKELLQRAIHAAAGRWFLEVRESNGAAIAFYKSLGFKPAGRRENYYYDPCEAAIVMSFLS